jgi:hypothetical protein
MCGLQSSCQTSLFSFPEARYTFTRHLESIPYLPGLMQTNYAVTTSKHVNLLRFWQSLQTKSCRFVSFFATNNSVSKAIHSLCLLGLSCTPTSFFWTRGEGAMKENFLQQLANFGLWAFLVVGCQTLKWASLLRHGTHHIIPLTAMLRVCID